MGAQRFLLQPEARSATDAKATVVIRTLLSDSQGQEGVLIQLALVGFDPNQKLGHTVTFLPLAFALWIFVEEADILGILP